LQHISVGLAISR